MAQHDSMIEDLQKIAAEHEEAARHLFVVCGQPDTQEGFEMAWAKEDYCWYMEWHAVHNLLIALRMNRTIVSRANAKNS